MRDAKTRSISESLTFSLVATIVIISLAFIALNYYLISEREDAWLKNKADDSIDTIAKTLEMPLWDLDRENIKSICTYYYHNELITMVKLTGVSGEKLYEKDKSPEIKVSYLVGRSRDIFHNGELIGNVRIGMAPQRSRVFKKELLVASSIALVISVLGLVVFTGILLRKFLRGPMDYLGKIVDSYSRGDYHPPLQDTCYSEFEPLVSLLFDMGKKIESQMAELRRVEEELKRHGDQLERMVEQRTRELETTNASLKREITERERTEEALREREGRLQAILAASPNPMVMYDTVGTPRYLNPSFTDVFGWTLDELKGRRIPFVPEDQASATEDAVRELYGTGTAMRFETTRLTKDGRTLDVDISAAIIKGPNGVPAGMIANLTDVSQRKVMQAQYEQFQRMESIGTLAGGIAHDFNNLLMGIQGRSQLMGHELETPHPQQEHIAAIEDYVERATNLTQQLLGFARGGKYEVKPVNLGELVLSGAAMFGRTCKDLRIHTKTQELSPVVEADKRQIEQVLLNLFVNARQAMPEGGELFLATSVVDLDEAACQPHQIEPGGYAAVSVTDTGVGMDEATQQRIFDPFFTTKDKGRGTGLGLASAYGIVKNHGGMITVKSEPGRGATFTVYLPVSRKKAKQEVAPAERLLKGSEAILLVDDEEMIIEVGKAMLEKLGYQVVAVSNGRQAVDTIRRKGDELDLVLLDMIMPDMDGGKTFDRIKEISPQLPVMLSSGYAIDGQAAEILDKGCNGFIQKPFKISELSRKIRRVLDGTDHSTQAPSDL